MKLLSVFCLVLVLIVSCQKKESFSANTPSRIRLNLKNEPATMDPRKGGDVISSHMHFLLFEGLVHLNPDQTITPAQAESFFISDDGLTYTFYLRNNITWSNGDPVTAYDFEKSWKDILDPQFPSMCSHLLYPIKNAERAKKGLCTLADVGIEAKDGKTFVVTLEKPTPFFLDLISFCVFFPVNIQQDRKNPNWAYDAGEHFCSNGPFLLKTWKHNDEVIAVKNPHYWDASRVRPEEIHFSMIDNETTALQMFERNELDMIGDPLSPLPVDALPALKKSGSVYSIPLAGTTIIAFNVDQEPFNNANIRKALTYAIDRKSIVKNITQMGEIPALNAVPPILKNERNHPFFKDADYAQAKTCLEEGMKELGISKENFSQITYYYSSWEIDRKIAQALQEQWKRVLGIELRLEHLDHKILMDKLIKRDYQLAQSLWIAQYNDQMNILERFKYKTNPKNYANWEKPEYIQLLEESFYANGVERATILEKAETLFLDEMPICPIYHWKTTYMLQPNLNALQMTPIGDIIFQDLHLNTRKSA